ncbi:hypothetical protein ISR92_02390 [Patescibacteria group bacterium]|nr:hypothetical protein [Patescibacteria group bacterium]
MVSNKWLFNKIKEMADIDQGLQFSGAKNQSTQESLFQIDVERFGFKDTFNKINFTTANALVYIINEVHNSKIKRLIERFGYPTQKMIGEEGMHLFGVLIQQQLDDPDLQKNCTEQCDFPGEIKAHIIDKMLLTQGKKQMYGTQYYKDTKSGEARSFPIESPTDVDDLRKEMGIFITIHDEKSRMTERYRKNV